jgi:hypothetical protein
MVEFFIFVKISLLVIVDKIISEYFGLRICAGDTFKYWSEISENVTCKNRAHPGEKKKQLVKMFYCCQDTAI